MKFDRKEGTQSDVGMWLTSASTLEAANDWELCKNVSDNADLAFKACRGTMQASNNEACQLGPRSARLELCMPRARPAQNLSYIFNGRMKIVSWYL